MKIKGKYGSKTDIGSVRKNNEDQALSLIDEDENILLCVCDGVGGNNNGNIASKLVVEKIATEFLNKKKWIFSYQVDKWINKLIKTVNLLVWKKAQTSDENKGMGTTLTMALFFKKNIHIVNIGDSRCYELLSDNIQQLTRDQTYAQYLVSKNRISSDEKRTVKERHALMNFIGFAKSIPFEYKVIENHNRSILLCSDGLYNNASDKQIFSSLNTSDILDQKIATLIGIAKTNGGTDNIAISLWEPLEND